MGNVEGLDSKNACLGADGLSPDVFSGASGEWEPSKACRFRQLNARAYVLGEAPATYRRSSRKYSANSQLSLGDVGLRNRASPLDPCLHFALLKGGGAVGAAITHIDDVLGCGEQDVFSIPLAFFEARFGS